MKLSNGSLQLPVYHLHNSVRETQRRLAKLMPPLVRRAKLVASLLAILASHCLACLGRWPTCIVFICFNTNQSRRQHIQQEQQEQQKKGRTKESKGT